MKQIMRSLWRKCYAFYGIRANVVVGRNLHLGIGSLLWAPSRLEVGNDVYIGKFCTIEVDGSIGDGTMLANNVGLIGRQDHDFRVVGKTIRKAPWVGDPTLCCVGREMRLVVGSDVWIGFGAVLLSGIEIGRGAIVGAGSVVTKDVPPYTIVAGNPAKPIGIRFSAEQIEIHEALLEE